jgi:hypothetical protein
LAVKDVSKAGASGRFDSAFGKLRVNRVELLPAEVADLAPVFPAMVKVGVPMAGADAAMGRPAIVGRTALIEVKPLAPNEAHKVLNKGTIGIATGLGLLILPVLYGSIAGVIAGIYYSHVGQWLDHKPVDSARLIGGLALAAVSLALAIFSGVVGLRNSGALGNSLFRHLSRRAIANRKNRWVEPERPGGLPVHFVQVVPRENWGTMKLETASDTGFLQIDPQRKELRFEGDVERYRIPAAAITGCSIASYSTGASANLKYHVVVIQGRTAAGQWEAPISLRSTKWLVPKDHRRRSAEMLRDQITVMLPINPPAAGEGAEPAPTEDSSQPAAEEMKPKVGWASKYGVRLAVVVVAIGVGVWRAAANRHQRERQLAQIAGFTHDLEPGEKSLRLRLTLAHPRVHQQITDDAPYCRDGGDWTVLDCTSADGGGAAFTVAIEQAKSVGQPPGFGFAAVALLPGSREGGARLVSALCAALHAPAPPAKSPQPLKVYRFSATVLGDDLSSPEWGLKSGGGTWVATQWSFENDGLDGAIYFNYDLTSGRAEMMGTSPDSDADVVEAIAAAVRDGPRPPRTAQNDPNFTNRGPAVVDLQLTADSSQSRAIFAPGGKLLICFGFKGPDTISAVTLDHSRQRSALAHFEGGVNSVICADAEANRFLVGETVAPDAMTFGPRVKQRVWWIDRTAGIRRELTGPWGDHGLVMGQEILSPDGRYAEISSTTGTVLDQKRSMVLYLVDVQSGKSVKAAAEDVFPVGWYGSGRDLRAVATHWQESGTGQSLLVDPDTGSVSPAPTQALPDKTLSPDGQMRFVVDPKVSVTVRRIDGGPGRTFVFEEEDRRYARQENISWLSPRYLRFSAAKQGFIDLATMKMGYLPTEEGGDSGQPFRYSRDFKWALAYGQKGLKLGRVVTPSAATKS